MSLLIKEMDVEIPEGSGIYEYVPEWNSQFAISPFVCEKVIKTYGIAHQEAIRKQAVAFELALCFTPGAFETIADALLSSNVKV